MTRVTVHLHNKEIHDIAMYSDCWAATIEQELRSRTGYLKLINHEGKTYFFNKAYITSVSIEAFLPKGPSQKKISGQARER